MRLVWLSSMGMSREEKSLLEEEENNKESSGIREGDTKLASTHQVRVGRFIIKVLSFGKLSVLAATRARESFPTVCDLLISLSQWDNTLLYSILLCRNRIRPLSWTYHNLILEDVS
ncbi:hypothetical protein Scep_017329 [Stephania cephalantha]|uniref:Uncharacterized protein n=1 Tax=Stephania cephalantha TaxID=152367 RepID=A0AAP0IR43_9MAGN